MPEDQTSSNRLKVLVALDGSSDWSGTVRYLGRIIGAASSAEILLYHVIEVRPESASAARADDAHENGPSNVPIDIPDSGNEPWLAERKSHIESRILGPARAGLEASETGGHMTVRTEIEMESTLGVAEKIMRKVRGEGCDTVVVGRRQRSNPHGPGLGQVAARIVHDMPDCTVWVLQ